VESVKRQMTGDELYWESFKRNIGILTREDQQRLQDCCIGIAGTGGVGGIYMVTLSRAGVGRFVISDPDAFDYSNINRQYGADVNTVGKNKARVMHDVVKNINPSAEIRIVEGGLKEENMEDFLQDCDLVLDSLDVYSFVELVKLHQTARRMNLYVLKGIPIGFGATLLVFSPGGMSFADYMNLDPGKEIKLGQILGDIEKVRRFYVKFLNAYSPSRIYRSYLDFDPFNPFDKDGNLAFKAFPSFCPSVSLCSALVTTEAVLIYLKKRDPVVVPKCVEIDLFEQMLKVSEIQ
jgi:molybdopterin/thiamine biosynthesis adenylyltransferase